MSLIDSSYSLNDIKSAVLQVLNRAGNDKHSAFRFIILNTFSNDFPDSRYVVLRQFKAESQELFIYTDYRSNKINEIEKNNSVSVLAYDKQKRFQIKLKAQAYIHHQDEIAQLHWASLHGGKESYNTRFRPGKEVRSLKEAGEIKSEVDDQYFAVIKLEVHQAEILQLNAEGHIRALFDFKNKKDSFLVP